MTAGVRRDLGPQRLQPTHAADIQNAVAAVNDSRIVYVDTTGWLGPDDMPTNGDQYWSRFNVLQSLVQLYEATGRPDKAAEWRARVKA